MILLLAILATVGTAIWGLLALFASQLAVYPENNSGLRNSFSWITAITAALWLHVWLG